MIKKKNSKFNFSIFKLMEYSEFSFLKTENFKKNDLIYINSFIKLNFNEKNFSFFHFLFYASYSIQKLSQNLVNLNTLLNELYPFLQLLFL